MLIPKANRLEVYKYLFKEGILYAKKDFDAPKHPEINVPNLQVIKLMQSFKSKGFVKETFAWRHYYWSLLEEGIEYLRTFLNLPSDVVPATLKKSVRPAGGRIGGGDRGPRPPREGGERPRYGDREGYRSAAGPPGGPDKGGAPGVYRPAFRDSGAPRGGYGRGGGGYGSGGYGGGDGGAPIGAPAAE